MCPLNFSPSVFVSADVLSCLSTEFTASGTAAHQQQQEAFFLTSGLCVNVTAQSSISNPEYIVPQVPHADCLLGPDDMLYPAVAVEASSPAAVALLFLLV